MKKRHYPLILIAIEVAAFAFGIVPFLLVTIALVVIYLASLRAHGRMRHWRCGGTGEHRGAVFTWTHRRCPGCTSGRIIRWGAGHWGSAYMRSEWRRQREARAAAKSNHTWR